MTLEFWLMSLYAILSLLAGIWAIDRIAGEGIKASRKWSGKHLHSPSNKIKVEEEENIRHDKPLHHKSIKSLESVIHHRHTRLPNLRRRQNKKKYRRR
jgi:hypothetical protein